MSAGSEEGGGRLLAFLNFSYRKLNSITHYLLSLGWFPSKNKHIKIWKKKQPWLLTNAIGLYSLVLESKRLWKKKKFEHRRVKTSGTLAHSLRNWPRCLKERTQHTQGSGTTEKVNSFHPITEVCSPIGFKWQGPNYIVMIRKSWHLKA